MRQIGVALSQSVYGNISCVYSIITPVVGGDELGKNFHSSDKERDVADIGRGARLAAEQPGFGNSGVG